MPRLRQDEFDGVLEAIGDGVDAVHISGQPGTGKSTFLKDIAENLPSPYAVSTLHVRKGNSPTTLTQDILDHVLDEMRTYHSIRHKMTGASLGFGIVSGGVSTDDRSRHLRKLAEVSESVGERNPIVLLVDDVHKLGEPEFAREYLRELSSHLGENVQVITAGRLRFDDADHTVELGFFSRDQSAELLQSEFPEISPDTVEDLHDSLDGHPYYLGLLLEAADPDGSFEIPEHDTREFIEGAYLDSMSKDEEEFIRQGSALAEMDEEICSEVLDGVSRTQARRVLDSLSSKAVVTEIGRSEDTGDRVFRIHDLFREFLHQHLDDSDQLHRDAFQYYAGKLFEVVQDSEPPHIEGIMYSLMANGHLREIYDGEPEVHQVRAELDRLGMEPGERLQFMYGYAPYAPTPGDRTDDLIVPELDDFTSSFRDRVPEDEEEKLQHEAIGVLLDLMRATHRSNADIEFNESSQDIYTSTIQRIDEVDFEALFEEDQESNAQVFPDLLRIIVHVAAYRDIEDVNQREEHLDAAFAVFEEYGLDRIAVEGFIDNCQELIEEYEPGEQAEEMVEDRFEESLGHLGTDDPTRNTLIRMQSVMQREMIELANSALTAKMSESDRLRQFVQDCGDSLAKAENPFFVAAWYSFAASLYRMFVPQADTTKELEEAAEHYADLRMEYEEELDDPIQEIEEFDVDDLDVPDVMDEIAEDDNDRQLTE